MKKHLVDFFKDISGKFLILYPQSFNSANVIAFLLAIKEFAGQRVTIITDDSKQINNSLSQVLPEDLYTKYADVTKSEHIKRIINDKGFIFIDDYAKYIQYTFDEFFVTLDNVDHNNRAKIICLTNGSDLYPDELSDWKKLTLNIFDEGPILNYNISKINKVDNNKLISNIINNCLLNYNDKHLIYSSNTGIKDIVVKYNIDNTKVITDLNNLDIKDIKYLHIVDINLDTFMELMAIYRRPMFSLDISTFNIIFYIDEDSDDVIQYEFIYYYIDEYRNNYIHFFKNSNLIKFNEELGIYVNLIN